MKKNININLFGTLYAIDEDACTLLENYLDNMRSYFAKRDGGDEIYDDIEHRVAEHLWSLKESGMSAIDIDTVKQIISSIGNPDEMESGVEEADDCQSEETPGAEAGDATYRQNEDNNVNSQDEDNEANRQNEANGSYGKDEDANNHGEGKWTDRVLHHVSTHRFYRDGKDKIGGGVIFLPSIVWSAILRAHNCLHCPMACGSFGANNRGTPLHDGQGGNARIDKQGHYCRGRRAG